MASNEEHRYALAELYELVHTEIARIEAWMHGEETRSDLASEMRARGGSSSGTGYPGYAEPTSGLGDAEIEVVFEEDIQGLDLIGVRQRFRNKLTELNRRLRNGLNEREVYYILFALVIHIDEQIRVATEGASERWEPLQKELYEIDNGGERFYTVLHDLYGKRETHPLVYESFYYSLSDGFTGVYADSPEHIEAEQSHLRNRIHRPSIESKSQEGTTAPIRLQPTRWRYYLVAPAAALLLYGLLYLAASGITA